MGKYFVYHFSVIRKKHSVSKEVRFLVTVPNSESSMQRTDFPLEKISKTEALSFIFKQTKKIG